MVTHSVDFEVASEYIYIYTRSLVLYMYEGQSNENNKSAITVRNAARLSCKWTTMITHGLKSGRQVAVRCRNATRRRSSSVKMEVPLATCTKEEQHSEGENPIEIHRRMVVQYGDACLSLQ
jgi:hypothetical protein